MPLSRFNPLPKKARIILEDSEGTATIFKGQPISWYIERNSLSNETAIKIVFCDSSLETATFSSSQ